MSDSKNSARQTGSSYRQTAAEKLMHGENSI